jgi:hypothetical protein
MQRLGKAALLFIAIGLAIYAGVYYAAEQLMVHTGRSNPLFKIAAAQDSSVDWVILGASHAMPLDFADFNSYMQGETGLRILNLASPGTGPLYNRFVLEHFLRAHRAKNVLYVVDSFGFYSRSWNEERFADAKLLARTPFEPAIAAELWNYARHEGVDFRAVLDYVTGFSKINNRERFERDVWEGEAQFDRVYRPSASAVKKRIAYLYPDKTAATALSRYLGEFSTIIAAAQRAGAVVVVIKMPTPSQYRGQLPDEAAFDQALSHLLATTGVRFHDFSQTMDEPRFYFDTDHLNRVGLTEFLARHLKPVLVPEQGDRPRT